MTDAENKNKNPDLKIEKKDSDLTGKQRAFVDEIIKGKLTYKDAYAKVYDVTLTKAGKVPKWCEVEASKLLANPKIALSIQKAMTKREEATVASSIRTRSYVLDRLMRESKESDSDASRVRALELLGKTIGLFSDTVEIKEARDSETIAEEIEEKIIALLEESQSQ